MFHTYEYALKKNNINCYSIEFRDSRLKNYFGNIYNFIQYEGFIYCVVKLFYIDDGHSFRNLTDPTANNLKNFLKYFEVSSEYVLIKPTNVIRRCIIIECYKEKKLSSFISPCINLNEHD